MSEAEVVSTHRQQQAPSVPVVLPDTDSARPEAVVGLLTTDSEAPSPHQEQQQPQAPTGPSHTDFENVNAPRPTDGSATAAQADFGDLPVTPSLDEINNDFDSHVPGPEEMSDILLAFAQSAAEARLSTPEVINDYEFKVIEVGRSERTIDYAGYSAPYIVEESSTEVRTSFSFYLFL